MANRATSPRGGTAVRLRKALCFSEAQKPKEEDIIPPVLLFKEFERNTSKVMMEDLMKEMKSWTKTIEQDQWKFHGDGDFSVILGAMPTPR